MLFTVCFYVSLAYQKLRDVFEFVILLTVSIQTFPPHQNILIPVIHIGSYSGDVGAGRSLSSILLEASNLQTSLFSTG